MPDAHHLVALGVDADLAVAVAAGVGLTVRVVPSVLDPTTIGARHVEAGRTIGVLARAGDGVDVARAVHRIAPDASVAFVADRVEEADELAAALPVTPGIGRSTRCLPIPTDHAVREAVDEFDRSLLRHRHAEAMDRVRGGFGALRIAPPATLVRYLGRLFDHAPIAIVIADATGRIDAANPAVERVLGSTPDAAVGHDVAALLGGEAEVPIRSLVLESLESGASGTTLLERSGPSGTTQHLDVTVAPVDPDLSGLGVIVLMHDETDRIEAIAEAGRTRADAEAAAARYGRLAATLQESLLPPSLPAIDHVDLAAAFRPAGDGTEIGGDFYDVFETSEGSWCVVLGDVCGKGAGAARLTALTRYSLRAIAPRSSRPEHDLRQLDRVLRQQYELDRERDEQRFATAVVARFENTDDGLEVRLAAGGHPPPLVLRADGTVEECTCRGPLLGVFADTTFRPAEIHLAAGDLLVLYTDGLSEARRDARQFDDGPLRSLLSDLAGRPAADVVERLALEALDFQRGWARDDLAIVAVGPRSDGPSDPPAPARPTE